MDLLTPVVEEDKLHHNFKMLLSETDTHKVLKSWVLGFVDRDKKFVEQFQTTFNSCFWELYLNAVLGNLGFSIDFSYTSPDFIAQKKNQTVVIEAVTTNNPEYGTPEHERIKALERYELESQSRLGRERFYDEVVSLATERILNSIKKKSDYFLNKYSKLEHVKGNPFVLAVGAFEQPLFYYQALGAIQKVLYGITKAEYRQGIPYFEYEDYIEKQNNGTKIPLGLFRDSRLSHISAIIFSPIATFGKLRALQSKKLKGVYFESYRYNDYSKKGTIELLEHKDYRETLLDGLCVYHNPYAEIPLDKGLFSHPDIYVNMHEEYSRMKHGFLFRRRVINNNNLTTKAISTLRSGF
ncbi:hypothetical protein [Paenibacillus sp. 481]|uniref:hypothetical protein n=1 Tax=Paenibacillus sp. 481 TaxID=2835869 RepID=UPI001E419CEC|nr:hypothetical protein [Paenibacillus sp. 481]UHA73503.1 hypothetical protein KIK04_23620 [Paenibacillus sp. 481]